MNDNENSKAPTPASNVEAYRQGIRDAVTFVHHHADQCSSSAAKSILNGVANAMSHKFKKASPASNVRALEWKRSGWVEAFSKPEGLGFWYSIQPHKPVHGPGDPPFTCFVTWSEPGQNSRLYLGEDFQSVDAAKVVAQADYERRILTAALSATATEGE